LTKKSDQGNKSLTSLPDQPPPQKYGGIPRPSSGGNILKPNKPNDSSQPRGRFIIQSNTEIRRNSINKTIETLQEKISKINKETYELSETIAKNGGKYCSWTQSEHADFLKIKTKHRGDLEKNKFISDCRILVPHFEVDEVKKHIE
jgi:hypothetical protein